MEAQRHQQPDWKSWQYVDPRMQIDIIVEDVDTLLEIFESEKLWSENQIQRCKNLLIYPEDPEANKVELEALIAELERSGADFMYMQSTLKSLLWELQKIDPIAPSGRARFNIHSGNMPDWMVENLAVGQIVIALPDGVGIDASGNCAINNPNVERVDFGGGNAHYDQEQRINVIMKPQAGSNTQLYKTYSVSFRHCDWLLEDEYYMPINRDAAEQQNMGALELEHDTERIDLGFTRKNPDSATMNTPNRIKNYIKSKISFYAVELRSFIDEAKHDPLVKTAALMSVLALVPIAYNQVKVMDQINVDPVELVSPSPIAVPPAAPDKLTPDIPKSTPDNILDTQNRPHK